MVTHQKILIIYNPHAGQKKRGLFAQTLALLRTASAEIDIKETTYAGHAREIAKKYKDGPYHKICAAGGDGTINEVLNGLYPCNLPLGIIPLGTANVLAKEILPAETPVIISKAIMEGTPKHCWLGKIEAQYFSLMVSMGPDAQTVLNVNLSIKKAIGKAAYALSFLKEIIFYRPVKYQVTIDGAVQQASAVIISKGKYYGGRYICAPDADLEKREFHIVLFKKTGRFSALGYALKMIFNMIPQDKSVEIITGKYITVHSDPIVSFQKDGDPGEKLPVTITLSNATIPIMTTAQTQ